MPNKMIRRSRVKVVEANKGKLETLDRVMDESVRVVNLYIDALWEQQNFSDKFVDFKVDTWLSARMQQCLGKQALEIVKSQRKKWKKTKPTFTSPSIKLDSRFLDIKQNLNSFDLWIKLSSIGQGISFNLPSRKTRHFNVFSKEWKLKGSCNLINLHGTYFIDLYFTKEAPTLKAKGKTKAVDIGYKNLLVTSEREFVGNDKIYQKMHRKEQGSKAFDRAIIERNEFVNSSCKEMTSQALNASWSKTSRTSSIKHEVE